MSRANRIIVAQLAMFAGVFGLAVTSHIWAPMITPSLDLGTGMLVVAVFGVGIVAILARLAWATVVSIAEWRAASALRPWTNTLITASGAVVTSLGVLYAARLWGLL